MTPERTIQRLEPETDPQLQRHTPVFARGLRAGRLAGLRVATVLFAGLVLAGCPKKEPEPAAEGSAAATEVAPAPTDSAATAEAPAATAEAAAPGAGEARDDGPRVERRTETAASRELATRLGFAPGEPLLVADLLTRADVREVTRFAGELMETSLEGIEPSTDYNTVRLAADGGYGFALQLWQFEDVRVLSNKFRRLRETYFAATVDPASIANEAFFAEFQGIRHYAFLHRPSKSVGVVTCEARICTSDHLRNLSQRVVNRL